MMTDDEQAGRAPPSEEALRPWIDAGLTEAEARLLLSDPDESEADDRRMSRNVFEAVAKQAGV